MPSSLPSILALGAHSHYPFIDFIHKSFNVLLDSRIFGAHDPLCRGASDAQCTPLAAMHCSRTNAIYYR